MTSTVDNPTEHVLEVELRGGLLLGGNAGAGFSDATVRDAAGRPFVPASALKGAIREQLGRLTNAETVRRILGGPGRDPLAEPSAEAGSERLGGGSTQVYLTDAVLVDPQQAPENRQIAAGRGFATRAQVSIDRQRRRASDGRLFHREVVAPFARQSETRSGPRFRSRVDLSRLDAEDLRTFRGAVGAVFALGASRTSGLGAVRCRLLDSPEGPSEPSGGGVAEEILRLRSGRIRLVLEARDPLCLGNHFLGNFISTLDTLRASTLRGAMVTAALAHRKIRTNQSEEPWFRRLLIDPETCLRFGDGQPVEAQPPGRAEVRVPPLTSRACKRRGPAHGIRDLLLREWLCDLAIDHGQRLTPQDHCPICGPEQRLIRIGGLLNGQDPEKRVVSRLSLDRRFARAAEGQFFSLELLQRGTRFAVILERVDEEARQLLADAAREGLRVGHGRGQGYGRVAIVSAVEAPDHSLASRLQAMDAEIRRRLEALARCLGVSAKDLGAQDFHFSLTLLSELLIEKPGGRSAKQALVDALGLGADVSTRFAEIRTDQWGGWDARARRPKPLRPVVTAGSVLLLRTSRPLEELLPRLEELERRGAGDLREEGYGWLRISDPIHLDPPTTAQGTTAQGTTAQPAKAQSQNTTPPGENPSKRRNTQ